ncbi:MAG: hypothetical protein ABFC85_00125 [Rectinema sp.]
MRNLYIGMWALALIFLIIILYDRLTGAIELDEIYRHLIGALG